MNRLSHRLPEFKVCLLLLACLFAPIAHRMPHAGWELPFASNLSPAVSPTESSLSETMTLQSLSKGISQIAKNAGAAVVMISSERMLPASSLESIEGMELYHHKNPSFDRGRPRSVTGMGSGFFIDLNAGLVVTNNHVVDGADQLHLRFANGKAYDAKVLARDMRTDIAVIKIIDPGFDREGLKTLPFGKSSDLEPGEFVLALGAPFGLEASVSFGVVSAMNRGNLNITELGDFIQTDAAINPGNSGGPLLNVEGHVVGISTAIYSQTGAYNGIGFAIPSNLVHHVVNKLVQTGRVERGYMGVRLRPVSYRQNPFESISPEAEGAVVAMVTGRSPAEEAGLREGDVILSIDNKHVRTPVDLTNSIGMMAPGVEVKLELRRGKDRKVVSLRLDPYPEIYRMPEAISGR